jgi:hypothetical protein
MVALLGARPAVAPAVEAAEQRLVVPGAAAAVPAPIEVWQVDASDSAEVYSNGLQIDLTFAVHNRARASFPIYALTGSTEPVDHRQQPRGIVYHTTESHLAPFEEESNRRLKLLARNLLDILRADRSYHYLIDRFGRVFRVVAETDAANHSGRSVWADARGIYVNLNDSFLGVAFEAQTGAAEAVTGAQITAARMLTEMLRSRYGIVAENCITHAQVSVNPYNMLIANHADWARSFPFAAVGLPDNYSIAPASVYAFGFAYDAAFLGVAGGKWPGLDVADRQVSERAALEGTTEIRYRSMLQHRYKNIAATLKRNGEGN